MKTAFCYHRFSHDDQKRGHTLETQRTITKSLADKYEATIIGIYEDEAISGATIDKRPGMVSLLEDLDKLKPTYLIATDQDRISRSNDFWYIKSLLSKSKTSIITEKEGILDKDDISKEAMSDMLAVFAKMERALIGKRIKRVFDSRRSQGQYIGGSPTGYYRQYGKLLINDVEAAFVRKVFDFTCEGVSTVSICRQFKDKRLFYPSYVSRMIQNPVYVGKMIYEGKTIDAQHEPIIDMDTFNKANEILALRKLKNRTRPAKYLLTGLCKCGKCGRTMTGTAAHYRYKGDIDYGYHCKGAIFKECYNSVSGRVEDIILERLYTRILKLKLDINKEFKSYSQTVKRKKLKEPVDNVKIVEDKISRLLEGYLAKVIDLDTYKKKNNALLEELQEAKNEIKTSNLDSDIIYQAYQYIRNLDIEDVFNNLELDAKRKLVLMFINKVIIAPTIQGKRDWKKRVDIDWKLYT